MNQTRSLFARPAALGGLLLSTLLVAGGCVYDEDVGDLPAEGCEANYDCPEGASCIDGACVGECVCPAVDAPVCGADGETYGNACEARCAAVEVVGEGACEDAPAECRPAECGPGPRVEPCPDGTARPQECRRDAANICTWFVGECADEPRPCDARECGPAPGAPNVQCEDGSIGGPVCERDDAGMCGWQFRECPDVCVCPDVWAPVCGSDGNTYGNGCEARCAGVRVVHEGECGEVGECAEDACGPPPFFVALCPDGSPPPQECRPADDGACRWQIGECPPVECAPDACGPPPPVAACPDGNGPAVECVATADGRCGWEVGPCDDICACPDVWAPVCGADGNTYGNACEARCAGVPVVADGECGGCACAEIWAPVCGADGNTYGNACEARCAGVPVAYEGECRGGQCAEDDCGPPPFLVAPCPDGNPPPQECAPGPDGVCGWQIGECAPICDCPDVWDPVCGVDGDTYGNACEARCAGVPVAHEGECGGQLCPEDACGERPARLPLCPDGQLPPMSCEPADDGACGWVVGECPGICDCPEIWAPVCGADGNTYDNECHARCRGVEVAHDGECGGECREDDCGRAPFLVAPCPDGSVPPQECVAGPDGMCRWEIGECPEPVCAADSCGPPPPVAPCPDGNGPTVECVPMADGRCGWEIGQCDFDCACLQVWDPVCGADGQTYGNACEADCAGVEVAYPGECRVDACALPPEPGPCEAAMRRWYHNAETGACEMFIYGGCQGNANNFQSAEACEEACGGGGGECRPEECGPAPGAPNFICEDGSVGGPVCERADDGVCGWNMRECPEMQACGADACGPAPRPRPCDDGSAPIQECVMDEAGQCGWTTECPAPPAECPADACGPAPRPLPCDDGSPPAQACMPQADGRCGWVTECR